MENKKPSVMMAIGRTRRAWVDYTKTVALEIGIPDSYRTIISFLARHPGSNQKNIAEFADITTAAVNQTVRNMITDNYVRKETDENDKRYTRLYLTEKGEITAAKVRERLFRSDDVITAAITPEKEAEMIELLDKIYDCIRRDLSSC